MNTKYTQKQRLAIAAVFEKAKNFLWDGKRVLVAIELQPYICFAINKAFPLDYGHGSKPHFARVRAKTVVNTRLGNFAMVEGYLQHTLGIPKKLLTPRNVQTFRHLSLDSLIEEFSK